MLHQTLLKQAVYFSWHKDAGSGSLFDFMTIPLG